MAVTVMLGTGKSGKSKCCFTQMREWAAGGGKALLIVPDQASYHAERQFAEAMPGWGFMGIQIVGFSRLAYRVFQERGKEHSSLSDLSRQLILQRLLRQYADEFTVLQTAARQDHFAASIGQFIWECRSFRIDADMLRQAAASLGNQTLGRKLEDIAVLYKAYTDFLVQHFGSADDVMTVLAREIPQYRFIQGARIWVDGFQWFTPQQLAVLQAAETAADHMTITLTMDARQFASQAKETALFHRAYEVYRDIQALFPQVERQMIPEPAPQGLELFTQGFFQHMPQMLAQPVPELHICECSNRDVEIAHITRTIQQLCRQGYRYRDFIILARSSEAYQHAAERIFTKYQIPFFSDYRRPMTSHPVVEAVTALLEVFHARWSYEAMFSLLKTDLFPISRHDADLLENYCLAYGIQGYHWLSGKEWTYWQRSSLENGGEIDGAAKEKLEEINAVRQRIVDLLLPCWTEAQKDHDVKTWCTLLYKWLVSMQVPQTLRQWKEEDHQKGQAVDEKEHEQVWKRLLMFLDEIVHVGGDDVISLREFSQIVTDGLKELKFSLIPPTLDHVTLTSVDRGYTMQSRVVFICGVNDGVFPQHSNDEGMLNDTERRRLSKLGIKLGPGRRFRSFQEKFLFYLAVTRARESLYLSYILADEDGKAQEASLWIQQLQKNGYVATISCETGSIPEGEEASFITAMPAALSYLPTKLRPAVEGKPIQDCWWALYDWAYHHGWQQQAVQVVQGLFHRNIPLPLSPELVRKLYAPDGTLRGSVTKFEQYRSCPFAYFSRYGLQLEERPLYQFTAPDLGMLVHGALRILGENLLKEGKQWHDLPVEEIPARCREATEMLAPDVQHNILMSNAYFCQIKERLIQTLIRTVRRLCELSAVSNFHMEGLETSFGKQHSPWKAVQFTLPNGMSVVVSGQIDRIDTMCTDEEKYVVVIDYKSGRKQLDLQEVCTGLELQLLTYMNAALQNMGEHTAPAAVLYCYVRNDKTSLPYGVDEETKKALYDKSSRLRGFYLDDSDIMKALDTTIDGQSSFLNIQIKKDGTLSNRSHVMYDRKGWKRLLHVSQNRLYEIAEKITAGDISIHPIRMGQKTPCLYCPYHAVCRFDTQMKENTYDVTRTAKAEEWLKKIDDEGEDIHGLD